MKKIKIKPNQRCPVCGGIASPHQVNEPWYDWICICNICGFCYSMLGDFGDTPEEAKSLWDWDVAVNGLDSLSLSEIDNEKESKYWKTKREEYRKSDINGIN